MKRIFVFASLPILFSVATLSRASADQPIVAPAASSIAPASPWREKGELSAEEVIASLGIAVSPEQRSAIDNAVMQRNAALKKANSDFSATLAVVLKADDAELTAKMAAENERRRMDLMRRRQPSRYEALRKR